MHPAGSVPTAPALASAPSTSGGLQPLTLGPSDCRRLWVKGTGSKSLVQLPVQQHALGKKHRDAPAPQACSLPSQAQFPCEPHSPPPRRSPPAWYQPRLLPRAPTGPAGPPWVFQRPNTTTGPPSAGTRVTRGDRAPCLCDARPSCVPVPHSLSRANSANHPFCPRS